MEEKRAQDSGETLKEVYTAEELREGVRMGAERNWDCGKYARGCSA